MDPRETLHRYLRRERESLVGKVEGLDEYDARRPLTPTGTNLLGLVKHVASVQLDYLGVVFGRPSGRELPWLADDAEPDADLWVPADESRDDVLEVFRFSCEHADATVEALPLDAVGEVPWWPEDGRRVTLHAVLVHLVAETARHAGHADIVRESVDGFAGMRPGDPNVTGRTTQEWQAHRDRIESAALEARSRWGASGG
ncbi:DinB family protein [Actinotalea sp. AC32]|nr:DinB family protein [Actinotalea sp. AC32]